MFSDAHILDFISALKKTCRIQVVVRVLFGVVFLIFMAYGVVKCLHKSPAKTAFRQTHEKEIPRSTGFGRLQNLDRTGQSIFRAGSGTDLLNSNKPEVLRPSLKLLRIIRFGRSLELAGEVETGSRLTVNDDPVEVTGDGSFKYFTKSFPLTMKKINLVLKVTNLVGKSSELIIPYNFSGQNRDR
jgi:hypothetical protein